MSESQHVHAKLAGTIDVGGDLTVNRLGFGAMRITGDGIWGWPKDRDAALKVLKRAVALGARAVTVAELPVTAAATYFATAMAMLPTSAATIVLIEDASASMLGR